MQGIEDTTADEDKPVIEPEAETPPAPDPDAPPAISPREARKLAAAYAKERFDIKRTKHMKDYSLELSEYQLADLAIEAKSEAEQHFGFRISVTLDVEGNWWFQ